MRRENGRGDSRETVPRLSVRLLLPRTLIFSTAHQRRSLPPPTPAPASSSLSISAKSAATTAAAKVAHRQEMGGGEGRAAQWAHSLRRKGGRGERSSALGLLPPSLDVRSQPADRLGRPPMCVSCCVAFPAHSYSMYTCMHRSACNE